MLIGFKLVVVGKGLEGNVIDETKNTLMLETNKGTKRVIKDGNRFILHMNKKEIKVDGNDIIMRSWEYAL
jgi:RNase P/RNase MRP subunit p29